MLCCAKDGAEPVGQEQLEAMMMKKDVRVELSCEQNHTMPTGNVQMAKQLLRIALISTCNQHRWSSTDKCCPTEAVGHGVFGPSDVWCRIFLLILFIVLTCAVFLLWRRIMCLETQFSTAVYNYEAGMEEMRDWAERQFGMLLVLTMSSKGDLQH
ncbi:unnamed protein product [Effrenium voratum]|nr:unnamed protein product [Effrenium voratum]